MAEITFNVPSSETKRYKAIVQQLCGRCGDGNLTIHVKEDKEYNVFEVKFRSDKSKKIFDTMFSQAKL